MSSAVLNSLSLRLYHRAGREAYVRDQKPDFDPEKQ
jgi:hypothetical protein